MIPSNKPIRSNSRGFQVCVLACVMTVLPLGVASAQDYDAVTKRLRAAVAAGELTGAQARTMLASLKKADSTKKQVARPGKKLDPKKANHETTWRKLQAMVKAGKLTEKQALAKMSAIKREAASKTKTNVKAPARRQARVKKAQGAEKQPDWAQAYLTKVKKELGAAVETGRISKEDAGKRFKAAQEAMKKRMAAAPRQARAKKVQGSDEKPDRTRAYLMRVRKELAATVAAGKLTREDAGKKYRAAEEGIKKRMEMGQRREKAVNEGRPVQGRRDARARDAEPVGRRRRAGVKAGKITEEDADGKWIEIKSKAVHKDVD